MKKIAVALMFAVLMFVMCVMVANAESAIYPTCGVVIEIDEVKNLVYVEDFVGNVWTFYGVEDWAVGDIAAMIMDTMGTECIKDDEIIDIRYCGWVW